MRDVFVFLIFLIAAPYALTRPFVGLLVFSWLAYMRPQNLCWGPARTFRFSFYIAIAMVLGWLLFERRPFTRWFPARKWIYALAFCLTGSLLTNELIAFGYQFGKFIDLLKVVFIALFTVGLVDSKKRLDLILWVTALSLGFYGVKGGIFGVFTGGRILQGPGGMLKDNNDLSLALNMVIPMLFYLAMVVDKKRIKRLMYLAVFFTVCSVIFTRSRGGFLTLIVIAFLMVMRSRKKAIGLSVGAACAIAFIVFLPKDVYERYATLKEPTEEGSAKGRLHAWGVAWNMFTAKPLFGVGFQSFVFNFRKYDDTPEEEWDFGKGVTSVRVAHNSYFQLLAESGGPAVIVFLAMIGSTVLLMRKLQRVVRTRDGPPWIYYYASMIEISLVGFAVGAFFLNRSHFDMMYHLVALGACTYRVAAVELANPTTDGGGSIQPTLKPVEVTGEGAFGPRARPDVFGPPPATGGAFN